MPLEPETVAVARATDEPVTEPDRRDGLRELAWTMAATVSVVIVAILPLVFNPRFYFADDTQAGAYPIWVSIGEHLRQGQLPFFEPSRWMSGNYPAEGQWGLFNPLVWLVGWFVSGAGDAVLASSVVKILFLGIAAGGAYLLARSYGATRPWAYGAGILAPTAGFTMYIDAASWVTALFVWALLPWVWWGLRRVLLHGGNPLVPFVAGYLLVTVGYVHGTLMMCFVIAGVLLEGLLLRRGGPTVRVLVVSCLLGAVAIAVYLPGVLTAPVTARDSASIFNTNFMSPDLSGLATSGTPLAQPWLTGFWGTPPEAPLLYVAWLLPLVALLSWSKVLDVLSRSAALLVLGIAAVGLVFGPSDVGPLRFPARVFPYLALAIVVLAMVLVSRATVRPTRGRVVAVLALVAAGGAFAWFEIPDQWKLVGLGMTLAALGLAACLWFLARSRVAELGLAATLLVMAVVVTGAQHWAFPKSPLPDFGLPASTSDYGHALQGVEGDTMIVGNPTMTSDAVAPNGDWWRSTLYANAWYLSDTTVVNTYSPILHRAFAEDLCVDAHGVVCWETLGRLMTPDETTGEPLVDLLAINAVQLLARPDAPAGDVAADPYTYAAPPLGWHEASRDAVGAVWSRDVPVDPAGGVVWTSDGVAVSDVRITKTSVTLHVDEVPAGGGTVVFSRLNWPGYEFEGAQEADPVRNYLLTAAVGPGASGEDVTVSFTPPAWAFELACLFGAIAVALVWGAAAAVGGVLARRRRTG